MLRRRDDPRYVRSALATLLFYGSLLAALATLAYFLRFGFVAALVALLLWLYRGPLFGLWRAPPRADVERLIREERERLGAKVEAGEAGRR